MKKFNEEASEGVPTNLTLITNLAQTVAKLQREVDELSEQVDSNMRDIGTLGEELAATDFKAGQALTTAKQFAEESSEKRCEAGACREKNKGLVRKTVLEYEGYYDE